VRRAPARDHVFGEGGEFGEALLDARRDEGAGALPAREEALRDQAVQRLAHGDPRDAQLVRKLALRRQRVVRRKHLALDGFTQDTLQLPIERRVILLIDAADAVSETTQDILRIAAVRDKTETI
jgi:hypothetical protein